MMVLKDAVGTALQSIRNRDELTEVSAQNGFYQGIADSKVELIRVQSINSTPYYPTLSGNKYRYAVRFMKFSKNNNESVAVDDTISFLMASC